MNFKVTVFGTYHFQVEYIRLLPSGSTIHNFLFPNDFVLNSNYQSF